MGATWCDKDGAMLIFGLDEREPFIDPDISYSIVRVKLAVLAVVGVFQLVDFELTEERLLATIHVHAQIHHKRSASNPNHTHLPKYNSRTNS